MEKPIGLRHRSSLCASFVINTSDFAEFMVQRFAVSVVCSTLVQKRPRVFHLLVLRVFIGVLIGRSGAVFNIAFRWHGQSKRDAHRHPAAESRPCRSFFVCNTSKAYKKADTASKD